MATIGPSTAPPTQPALAAAVDPAVEQGARRTTAAEPPAKWTVGRVLITLVLVGFAALFLYPLVWLVAASLKPASQVFDNRLIPKTWSWDNYSEVWNQLPLVHWMFNSIAIALLAAAAVSISSSVVAFGFAYFRFPGRNVLFWLVLASMMLPGAVMLVPNFLIWNALGQVNSPTFAPLWAGNLFGSAFYIFLLRQFFLGLPRETFEAARVDGASYPRMFWSIALPLTRAALIVVFIFELRAAWTDLMRPLIFLRDLALFTLPQGLQYLVTIYNPQVGGQGEFHLVMAASVLITLPMILVFFLAQRYFIEGIATTGSKG